MCRGGASDGAGVGVVQRQARRAGRCALLGRSSPRVLRYAADHAARSTTAGTDDPGDGKRDDDQEPEVRRHRPSRLDEAGDARASPARHQAAPEHPGLTRRRTRRPTN